MPPKKKNQKAKEQQQQEEQQQQHQLNDDANNNNKGHKLHMDLKSVLEGSRENIVHALNSLRRRGTGRAAASTPAPAADAAVSSSGGKKKPAGKKGKKAANDSDEDAAAAAAAAKNTVAMSSPSSSPNDVTGFLYVEEAEVLLKNLPLLLKHLRDALQNADTPSVQACVTLLLELGDGSNSDYDPNFDYALVLAFDGDEVQDLMHRVLQLAFENAAAAKEYDDDLRQNLLLIADQHGALHRDDVPSGQKAKFEACRSRLCKAAAPVLCSVLKWRAEADRRLVHMRQTSIDLDKAVARKKNAAAAVNEDDNDDDDDDNDSRDDVENRVEQLKQRLAKEEQEYRKLPVCSTFGVEVYRSCMTSLIAMVTCSTTNKAEVLHCGGNVALPQSFLESCDIHLQLSALELIFRITRNSHVYFHSMPQLPGGIVGRLKKMGHDASVFREWADIVEAYNTGAYDSSSSSGAAALPPRADRAVFRVEVADVVAGDAASGGISYSSPNECAVLYFTPRFLFIVPSPTAAERMWQAIHGPGAPKNLAGPVKLAATVPFTFVRSVRAGGGASSLRLRMRRTPDDLRDYIICAPLSVQAAQQPGAPATDTRDSVHVAFSPAAFQRFKQSAVRVWLHGMVQDETKRAMNRAAVVRPRAGEESVSKAGEDAAAAVAVPHEPSRNSDPSVFMPSMSVVGLEGGSATPGFAAAMGATLGSRSNGRSGGAALLPATDLRAQDAAASSSDKKSTTTKKKQQQQKKKKDEDDDDDDDDQPLRNKNAAGVGVTPARAADKILEQAARGAAQQLNLHSPSPMPKNPKNKVLAAISGKNEDDDSAAAAATGTAPAPAAKKAQPKRGRKGAATAAAKGKKASNNKRKNADAADSSSSSDDEESSSSDDEDLGTLMARKQKELAAEDAAAASKKRSKSSNNSKKVSHSISVRGDDESEMRQQQQQQQQERVISEPPFEVSNASGSSFLQQGDGSQQLNDQSATVIDRFRETVEKRVGGLRQDGLDSLNGSLGRLQGAMASAAEQLTSRIDEMEDLFCRELDERAASDSTMSKNAAKAVDDMNAVLTNVQEQTSNATNLISVLEMQCASITQNLRAAENGRVQSLRSSVENEVADIKVLFNQRISSVNPLHTLGEFLSRNVSGSSNSGVFA